MVTARVGPGHQHRDISPDDFLRPVAEYLFRRRAQGFNESIIVDGDDGVGRVVDDGAKTGLAFANGALFLDDQIGHGEGGGGAHEKRREDHHGPNIAETQRLALNEKSHAAHEHSAKHGAKAKACEKFGSVKAEFHAEKSPSRFP